MTGILLFAHILGAILAIGPVAVAASMFPPAARAAHGGSVGRATGAVPDILHRITRVYAVIAVTVPVFGLATAVSLGVLGEAWLLASMALTAVAAVVLTSGILPGQKRLLPGGQGPESALADQDPDPESAGPGSERASVGPVDVDRLARRLAMQVGVFNMLWVIVLVLMIYRP